MKRPEVKGEWTFVPFLTKNEESMSVRWMWERQGKKQVNAIGVKCRLNIEQNVDMGIGGEN